jgi:hypothetical protein
LVKPAAQPQPVATPIKPAQQIPKIPAKKRTSILSIVGIIILFWCGIGFARSVATNSPRVTPTARTQSVGANSVVFLTFTPEPTNTPQSTRTPRATRTQRPIPTENIGAIGEPREAGGITLTVLNVTQMDRISSWSSDSGYTFLVIDVEIANTSRTDETPYNPLYFSVKDVDNFEYSTTFVAPDPRLRSGTLPLGEKARGNIAFEVRSASKGFVVTYKPLVLLGGYEPIRISLDTYKPASQEELGQGPCQGCNFECPQAQGEFQFCVVDPELVIDKNLLASIVHEYCKAKGTGFCKFLIWDNLTYLPTSLPLTDIQVDNQVADYTKNITTGNDCLKVLSRGSVIYSSEGCK